MKFAAVFIAFFLLIGAISAVPTHHNSERTTTCSKKCLNHENNLFQKIGSTHSFNYETESEIKLENGQKTYVSVKAKVDISTISNCEHQMQLRKVQINGPEETEIMKKELERYSIRYSQDNSRIESICHDESEETWVLNFKKAILSTIQVTVREQTEQMVEKDVLGFCNTKYEQISSNTLQKTKFLNTCTKRSENINSILTGDFNKEKRSTCKIQLNDGKQQLKSVVCEETNSMLPFAHSKASGHVSTVTKMDLEKVEQTLPQVSQKQMIRDNLQFNKRHFIKNHNQDLEKIVQAVEQILDEIRSDVEHNVQKETPEKIRKLSQYLAHLNVKELELLAQKVSNKNDKVKDIFFDTVAQTKTQESAHIILKVILDRQFYQDEVSKVRKAFWLSMLSNVDQVTDEILPITLEHIKRNDLPRQALFALTSMIHEIKDDEEIKQDSRYQQVVNVLIEKLNRQTDKKEKIVLLKALRNTGIHQQNFNQIWNIAQQSRDVEIRIAAIQALEQHVQEEGFFKKLMKIFENSSNEAEVRIAAFKVLVNNQERVHELNKVLDIESNKQVGSYVVSFFKNAKDNQCPEFETLRRIASTFDLPEKKFERVHLRNSRHIQFTQQIEKLDLGAQVEADLIFDEQKQLRNVRARFDLNKENLQMKSVEITLRQTGLPEVAQQMVQELTNQANLESIVDEIKQLSSIRSKHQLNQKINRLVQLFNFNKINFNRKWTEQMDASINVRLEDKTVMYLSLKDIQEYSSALEQRYQREQILDQIFDHLTGDNAITLILSNRQRKMPTAHSLPVHTGVSLVVVAALKTENGAFYPSIATDSQFEMGFSIMHVRPAIHYHLQMHSAPGLKMNVERKNGVPIKLQISMPENRLKIISVKSVVKLQTAENKEIELNVLKKESKGCTRMFHNAFGVELCQKTVTPRNLFEKDAMNALFNGPIELSLNLEKTDSSIKFWEIVFETQFAQRSEEPKTLHLALNTVGSRKNRELSAKIELQNERESKILHIDLKTPVKSAKIEARIQMNKDNLIGKAALMMDRQRFEAEIGVERTLKNEEHYYKPTFKLTIPGMKKMHYVGKIAWVNSGKKESFQIELRDIVSDKAMIKASAIKSGKIDARENFKLATDLQAFWFTGSSIRFVSNIDKNSNGLIVDFETIHLVEQQAPTTYKWKVALKDLSNNDVTKYNADFELNLPNTDFENIAFSYNFVKRMEQEVETELTAFWNNQNGQKTRQMHILQQLKMNKVSAKISSLWENLLKIEIVPLSVHYEVQAKTNWQRSQQKYNVQLTTRNVKTNKQYKGEMSYQLSSENKPFKMNLDAKVLIEKNEFKITHNIEEQEKQEYHGRTMIQLRKGQHIEANYVYRMREHSLQIPRLNHELEAEIRVPSKSITIKQKSTLKMNSNQLEIKHSLRKNNAVLSDIKVSLNKNGQSQVLVDNQLFQIKVEGDLTNKSNKKMDILLNGKNDHLYHHSKLQWSGRQQFNIKSKTTKNQQQLAEVSIDYQKSQKAEIKIQLEKLGELLINHQPTNGQKWGTVELKSDYFSTPIRQQLVIEKSSNKYTIRSKTQQNQQIVGELDLQVGSSSSLKLSALDWKLTGRTEDREMIKFDLENLKMNIREELELQYKNKEAKILFKHLDSKKRTTTMNAELSTVQESSLKIDNERVNFEFTMKPTGQEKHAKLIVNDKKYNIQHQSELRYEESTLSFVLEHDKDNQNFIKHSTKLSKNDDSHTITETKKFTIEANYRKNSAFEVKFNHQNGVKHSTIFEIIDLRNQIGKISSSTMKNDRQIVNVDVDVDTIHKINANFALQKEEINLKINLKDYPKRVELLGRCPSMEIRSKWNKDSHKEQKYTLEIVDKKHDSKYNLLAHHQRKTMFNIKIESLKNGKTQSGELKLHKDGEAFLKVDGTDMKMKSELNFKSSPVEASVKFESRKRSIRHQTTVTFLQQENELKIKSETDKNSRKIANVDFSFNPTTKQILASGKVDNKNLKIEGNVNSRYLFELKSEENQFKHLTELDLNARTFNSETLKNNEQLHKIDVKMANRFDVNGSMKLKEHELIFKSNARNDEYKLNYNNKRIGVKSTGHYTINRNRIGAKINAQLKTKEIVDLETVLRLDDKSLDGKMTVFNTKSSVQIKLEGRKELSANIQFENQERKQKLIFIVDSTNQSEKHLSAKIHTQNWRLEKQIKLVNSQELLIDGKLERNGQKLVQGNIKIAKPFELNGKFHFDTRNFKGHATLDTSNSDEIKVEFFAKDSQDKNLVDLKSKITKENNKLNLKIDFDSHRFHQYTLTSELKKESKELRMNTLLKLKGEKVGKLDARIKREGYEFNAQLDGELKLNGKKSEINYKLSNLNKFEHVLKIKKDNKYSYGFDISAHLKQGKFIIHLPDRTVELRYDVTNDSNRHVLVNLQVLPNSVHQPNNIYTVTFDNSFSLDHQVLFVNTKAVLYHPEIHHPIEVVFRGEVRELNQQKPLVVFVSYDASQNQKNRNSVLFEISNETNARVAHFNISHQNQPILDVHYRWAINYHLIHQQLTWSILKQYNQKATGELLGQINLRQRQVKLECNNKHKLQINWEKNFDQNAIIQMKAQTDNLNRKMKIMTNYQNGQIEITNFENEKMQSNYIVSVLKEKNTLLAIEMHKKQGSKLEKVAFIQLVKDSLNYAKVHLKVEKSLIYEIESSLDQMKNKVRSSITRHTEEISSISRQQYENLKLKEQIENTSQLMNKINEDLAKISDDCTNFLQQYLPKFFEGLHYIYQKTLKNLREILNVNVEQKIGEFIGEFFEKLERVQEQWNRLVEILDEKFERINRQYREVSQKLNNDVIVNLSNQIEQVVQEFISLTEEESERAYEFLHKNLKHVKLQKIIESIRSVIVKIKNQIQRQQLHSNLHKLVYNMQKQFEGKLNLKGEGEIIAKIYFPTRFISKLTN